jgi:hypothetical protein
VAAAAGRGGSAAAWRGLTWGLPLLALPLAFLVEGPRWGAAWQAAEVTSTGLAEVVCQAGDGRPCLRRGGCGGEGGG